MELRTLDTKKLIAKYKIKEVVNSNIDGAGGLFDSAIFGTTVAEKKEFMGYIDLKGHFIDMATYKVARRLYRELPFIIDGSKKYKIESDGTLTLDANGNTGIDWFYKNFNEIKFTKLENNEHNRIQTAAMKKSFLKLTRDDFFVDKIMVLPQHYRDIDTTKGSIKIDELNQYYIDLIKACSFRERQKDNKAMEMYFNDAKIQGILMMIYEYIENMIFGKTGVQRDGAMGRSIDNGVRIVIVAPDINPSDTIGESPFDLDQTNLPLHHIMNAFPQQTIGATYKILNSFFEMGLFKTLDRETFEMEFGDDTIKEKIINYYHSYAERFEKIKYDGDKTIQLHFSFKDMDTNAESIEYRDVTWMDVFYLAVSLYISNVRSLSTRFPVTDKGSLIFCKINILVFNKDIGHMAIRLNDSSDPIYEFDRYPNVHKYEDNPVSYIFEETSKFSNLYLDSINGDYDGDKVSIKSIYSEEAVAEIDRYNNSPMSLLSISGANTRNIGKEGIQALYNLTVIKKEKDTSKLKDLDKDMTDFIAKDKYKLIDVIDLLEKYDPDIPYKYGKINTTVGRVVFNTVVFGHVKDHEYINETITKDALNKIMDNYSAKFIEKSISVDEFKRILNSYHTLAFGITELVSPSVTFNMLIKDDKVYNAKKAEIYEKYKTGIESGDTQSLTKYEGEVIAFSKEYYKDDPMYDMYASGASPKWDVDFKSLKISLGVTPVPGSSEVAMITSNLKDGIKNEDIVPNTNMQIFGASSRALLTAGAGYKAKKMEAATQSTYAKKGDCGSTDYLETTDYIKGDLLYRYIKNPNGPGDILLTPDIVDNYIGVPVKKRSPLFCKSPEAYCSHCTGEMLFEMTGLDRANVGFYLSMIGTDMLNKFMKATHNMSQKTYVINDLDEFIR